MQQRIHKTIRIPMGSIPYDDQASAIDDAISLVLVEIESKLEKPVTLFNITTTVYADRWLFVTVIVEL